MDRKSEKHIEDVLPIFHTNLYRDAVKRVCDENGADRFTRQQLIDHLSKLDPKQTSRVRTLATVGARQIALPLMEGHNLKYRVGTMLQILRDYAEVEFLEPGIYRRIPHIGEGSESVYVFYYPAYRELAALKGQNSWPCKIGRTVGSVYERVISRGTLLPERPRIAFVLNVPHSKEWEKLLQLILKARLQDISEAPGQEWFNTTPEKILKIIRSLIESWATVITAGEGDVQFTLTAQYIFGVMCRDGQGGPQDYVKAHAWLSLAAEQGFNKAVKACHQLTKQMSSAQIEESQALAANLFKRIGPTIEG